MKLFQIYLGLLMMVSFVFMQSSWWNIYSTTTANNNDTSQDDMIKKAASNRLAALQENRAKHAKIAQEAAEGKYGSEKNFEIISQKEQDILDQQIKEYFEHSWISLEDKLNVKNQVAIDKFFNENKELIKENYRLAQKLTDPEIMYFVIEFLSKLPIEDIIALNSLALINVARQIPQLKNKAEASAESQITFKDRFFVTTQR